MPAGYGGISRTQPGQLGGILQPTAPSPVDPSTALLNQYKLYDTGLAQNAGAYDTLMNGYKSIFDNARVNTPTPITPSTYTPEQYNYAPSASLSGAISNLGDLSRSGGYSGSDVADIRARGISPIRSIYANANRDIDRQRALQGGYSPNYSALKAKMAREMSEQIAGQVTNVNAQLAQSIAQNKLNIAPSYASAAGQESSDSNRYGAMNTEEANKAKQFNIENQQQAQQYNNQLPMQSIAPQLDALKGIQSLYGTTPALTSLFGNQAMEAAQMANNQNNNLNQTGVSLLSQTAPYVPPSWTPNTRRLG